MGAAGIPRIRDTHSTAATTKQTGATPTVRRLVVDPLELGFVGVDFVESKKADT